MMALEENLRHHQIYSKSAAVVMAIHPMCLLKRQINLIVALEEESGDHQSLQNS